ncbi:MAG: ROK family protein, partial [Candidatus Limiplasma sp.]|nr:ROK family protein [Candidatus Limiplasma sp.]
MVYIGIDVGGTGIKVGIVNDEGCILAQGETPTLVGRPFEDIVRDMATCAQDVLARSGYSLTDVHSVGVGVPGVANQESGVVVFCTNLGWHNVPLRAELQKHISKPVFIDNDATVAGYAESICGVSVGSHSSVFMTLGTGVGGGIVIGGKPWSGFHGIGSEIGHIPMDIEGVPCTCGNRGCLERYCSATAII